MENDKKTCLVTGASSGIGRCICKILAAKNFSVIGIARREDLLTELKAEIGENFIPFTCDVTDAESVKEIYGTLKSEGILPDTFILNAGYGYNEETENFEYELHKTTFEINYFGVMNFVNTWLPDVLEAGKGSFVAVSSLIAFMPEQNSISYGASKAAIAYAFDSMMLKYHLCDIKFSVVYPGPVETALLKVDKPLPFTMHPEKAAKRIIKKVLKGKRKIFFSVFWRGVLRFYKILPDWLAFKMLKAKEKPKKGCK